MDERLYLSLSFKLSIVLKVLSRLTQIDKFVFEVMRDSLDVCISNLHKKDIENVRGMRVCGSNMQKTRDIKSERNA